MRSGYRGRFGIVDADPTCCDSARLVTTEPIGLTSSFSRDRLHSPSSELNDPVTRATSGTITGSTPCSAPSAEMNTATSRQRRWDAMGGGGRLGAPARGRGERRCAPARGRGCSRRAQNRLRTLQWHRHQQRQQQRQHQLQHQLHPSGCCRPNVIPRNM